MSDRAPSATTDEKASGSPMSQQFKKPVLRLVSAVLVLVVAFGLFGVLKNLGWLSPFGIEASSNDSQVVQAVKRTQEVSLLSLRVQGIKDEHRDSTVFGKSIPGTGETLFLKYSFTAKLGFDGEKTRVTKVGDSQYRVEVPEFVFIGYDTPKFEVAAQDSEALSWFTPEIDQLALVNQLLNDRARQVYLVDNRQLLQDQAKVFYTTLISSVDPSATTTFEFRS